EASTTTTLRSSHPGSSSHMARGKLQGSREPSDCVGGGLGALRACCSCEGPSVVVTQVIRTPMTWAAFFGPIFDDTGLDPFSRSPPRRPPAPPSPERHPPERNRAEMTPTPRCPQLPRGRIRRRAKDAPMESVPAPPGVVYSTHGAGTRRSADRAGAATPWNRACVHALRRTH